MPKKFEFTELDISYMTLGDKRTNSYKVYKTADEVIEVEAETAAEAISKSGVEAPYKVVHYLPELTKVTTLDKLDKINSGEEPIATQPETNPQEEGS